MLRRLSVVAALVMWCLAGPAQALGLGEIQMKSGLGQPFSAVIPFDSLSSAEAESVSAHLARNAQFEQAGLERSAYLSTLTIETFVDGANRRVEIRSSEIAREPLLTLLIEVRTAGGPRVLRQYSVFLDPPAAPVLEAAVAAPVQEGADFPQDVQTYEPAPRVEPASPAADTGRRFIDEEATHQRPVYAATTGPSLQSQYGPVRSGEALWQIATQSKPADVGVNQAILGIYEANPGAFFQDNINSLQKGVLLDIPSADVMRGVSESAARLRVASLSQAARELARSAAEDSSSTDVTSVGKEEPTSSPVAEAEPAAVDVASDRDERAGNAASGEEPSTEDTVLASASPDGIDADGEALVSDSEVSGDASLDVATDTEAVQQIESTAADALVSETAPWTVPVDATESDAAEETLPVSADSARSASEIVAKPAPRNVEAPLLGKLWIGLIGIAGLIAALFGIAALRKARERKAQREYDDALIQAQTGSVPAAAGLATAATEDAPVSDSPRSELERIEKELAQDEDATRVAAEDETVVRSDITGPYSRDGDDQTSDLSNEMLTSTQEVNLGENDPVSEADFHLAYGLYDEAALMLQQASAAEPDRADIKVKLAETYFAAGKPQEFARVAEPLKAELSAEDWSKVAIMGRQICPSVEAFTEAEDVAGSMSVDLNFEDVASASKPARTGEEALEFNLEELELPSEGKSDSADKSVDLDFDLGEFDLDGAADGAPVGEDTRLVADAPAKSTNAVPTDSSPASAGAEVFDLDFEAKGDGAADGEDTRLLPEVAAVKSKDAELTDSGPASPGEDMLDIDFDAQGSLESDSESTGAAGEDDAGTKLDLARAYVEMGDSDMANSLLDEVDLEGDEAQKTESAELRRRLSS